MKGLHFSLPNGVRADKVSLELLREMQSVGFEEIAFGVEVGNDKMLQRIGKQENMKTIEKSISQACSLGYRVILFFIIGYPGETWNDIEDSFQIAKKYPVFSVRFYNLIPFPGTQLYRLIQEQGSFVESPEHFLNHASGIDNEPTFQTPELSLEERKKAFTEGGRIHREVLRRYLRHKFNNLGFCSEFLVRIVSSEVFLNAYWNNRVFRRLVARFKSHL
jgi:coproporphyrinogen III oxidase-like Fe-S oxidoreductase